MADETNRLKSAQLDADISVLGDDSGGDPKMGRTGGAPVPEGREGSTQAVAGENPPRTNDDPRGGGEIGQNRAAAEARREVVDRYGKG